MTPAFQTLIDAAKAVLADRIEVRDAVREQQQRVLALAIQAAEREEPCHLGPVYRWAPRCGAPQPQHNLLTTEQVGAVTCVECLRAELAGGSEQAELSANERAIMEHALGWSKNYRNRFVTGPDTDDWAPIQELCRRGLMVGGDPSPDMGGMTTFGVTDAGIAALGVPDKQSKRRNRR